jgi:hypothetical protein
MGFVALQLSMGQLLSIPMVIIGLILLTKSLRKMKQYLELLDYILQHGEDRGDRTGPVLFHLLVIRYVLILKMAFLQLQLNHLHGKESYQSYCGF